MLSRASSIWVDFRAAFFAEREAAATRAGRPGAPPPRRRASRCTSKHPCSALLLRSFPSFLSAALYLAKGPLESALCLPTVDLRLTGAVVVHLVSVGRSPGSAVRADALYTTNPPFSVRFTVFLVRVTSSNVRAVEVRNDSAYSVGNRVFFIFLFVFSVFVRVPSRVARGLYPS